MENKYLIDAFFIEEQKNFLSANLSIMKTSMQEMSSHKLQVVVNYDYHKPLMIFFISYFFGSLGIDRFIIGDKFIAILKFITLGGLGVWYIIDLFLIIKRTKCNNYRDFEKLASNISI